MEHLPDKVAIITGASSGIGRVTALALARAGVKVTLAARRAAELQAVAAEIRAAGGEALVAPTTLQHFGRLDIVVANAGVYVRCRLTDPMTDPKGLRRPLGSEIAAAFEDSLRINFFGSLYPVLAALPHLVAQGSGHIVLISSMDAKKGIPPDAPYVAAKSALAGFGGVLRQELHGTGVGVSIIYPGRVATPLIGALKFHPFSAPIAPETVATAVIAAIRRGRAEVIVPPQAWALVLLNALSLRLGDWAARAFRLEGWE
jgi:NAD(P)-dependent dehydrogenase (short-subunit alcohol dehydrogenase family)